MPDLVKKWREQHPYLSALEDEINADYNSQKYQQEKQNEQYEQQRKEYEQWVQANQYGPYGDERDRAAPRGVSNALTPDMEYRRQQAATPNKLTPYQVAMQAEIASLPTAPETRSNAQLRNEARSLDAASRVAKLESNRQGLLLSQDPTKMYNQQFTTGLRDLGKTANSLGAKAATAKEYASTIAAERAATEAWQNYAHFRDNPDFIANSKPDPKVENRVYYSMAHPEEAIEENGAAVNAAAYADDDDKAMYFYLWNTYGHKAADKFYDDYVLNKASAAKAADVQRRAMQEGYDKPFVSSVKSIGTNVISGVGLVDMFFQNISRDFGITNPNRELNYNSLAQMPSLVTDSIREGVMKNINGQKVDDETVEAAAWTAAWLYQNFMSAADSGVGVVLTALGVPSAATLAIMAGAAGTRAIQDARKRGATDSEALRFGMLSAAAEAAFEKISLDVAVDSLLGSMGRDGVYSIGQAILKALGKENSRNAGTILAQWALNSLTNSFVEGSEELLTTIANDFSDRLILGDRSEFEQKRQELLAMGVSDKEAARAALKSTINEALQDAAAGAFSGFLMGGGTTFAGQALRPIASTVSDRMQMARELTNYQRGAQQLRQMESELRQVTRDQSPPAAPAVQQRQLTEREQNPLQFALTKAQNGETVTGNDAKAILNDPQAVQTLRDAGVLAENIRTGADGRTQIQQAVQALAEQNRAETPETQQATERTSQLPVPKQQETAQERTTPPLPRQMAQEQQERVTTPPVPQNTQEAAQGPTLRVRAKEEQALRQETLRIQDGEVTEPTQQESLTIRDANATVEENRQEENYGQGQQTETAAAAGEGDFRSRAETAAEGARRSYLDRIERSSGLGRVLQDLRNYRVVRGAESRASEVSRIRNQAEAGNQRDVSAQDYGIANGSAEQSAKELDNATASRVLGRNWDRAVAELARQGVTLKAMTGQLKKEDGTQVRAFFSGDGKTIIVQADHPKLSWNQLLDHEDLHRRIKADKNYRKAVEDALLADRKLQAYLPEIIDRYAQAYARLAPGLSSDDVIEELLADYRAGFDMLDPLGMNPITARAAKRAAKDIKAVEQKGVKQTGENRHGQPTAYSEDGTKATVDDVAVASNIVDTITEDPRPFDYMSADKNSIETFPDWAQNFNKRGGENAQQIVDAIRQFTEAMIASDVIMGYVPVGSVAYNKTGPLRKNIEYVFSFDMDASCPRTFQFLNYRNELQRIAGRPLTYAESIQLIELMRAYGQQIPCSYCYVENKRVLLANNYLNWFGFYDRVVGAETDEEARKLMYGYNEKKDSLSKGAESELARWRKADKDYRPKASEVWLARQTAKNSVFNWLDQRNEAGLLSRKVGKNKIVEAVCKEFKVTDKAAKAEITDFVGNWVYDRDMKIPHNYEIVNDTNVSEVDQRALNMHRTAMAYANSASSARTVDNYMPYTDQIWNVTAEQKRRIMAQGGIRKHSSNDFRMDYVQDYFMFFADLAAGGWTGHTYTKNVDYVKIFGRTGDRINVSVAFTDENGQVRENMQEGMGWKDAQQLRKDYAENVGVMAMVTSDAQLSYALNSDWIDMIIPFHASGLDKSVWYNIRMWQDYTSKQNERWYTRGRMEAELKDAGVTVPKEASSQEITELYRKTFNIKMITNKDGLPVKPHFLPGSYEVNGQTVPGHNNDKEKYFQLCKEYGVVPRFQGILVDDGEGNMIDVTEHRNYMKLVKETARTDVEQKPIQFNFDQVDPALGMTPFEYAMQRMQEEARNGGYANTAEDKFGIVKEFQEEYLGKNIPLPTGLDENGKPLPGNLTDLLTDRAIAFREGLMEMQNQAAQEQAQVVEESQQEGKASTEIDTDYLAAVNSGDMETAQRMVDEAAREAGYNVKGYHGTAAKFTKFQKSTQGKNWSGDSRLGPGFYFAHDKNTALKWTEGTNVVDVWLKMEKPLDLRNSTPQDIVEQIKKRTEKKLRDYDSSYPLSFDSYKANVERMEGILLKNPSLFIDEFKYDSNGRMTDGIREFLSGFGYDGIISEDEIVVFEPEQIKSADPVTYDDNRKIIPLSQRFNPADMDIRYSVEIDPDVAKQFSMEGIEEREVQSLLRENEELKKKLKDAKAQIKTSDRTQPREEDVRRMARELLKAYSSKADGNQVNESLRELAHTVMSNDARWTDIRDQAVRLAGKILEESSVLVGDDAALNREIRNAIRKEKIAYTNKGDIADYGQWRKDNFGKLKIAKDGIPVDTRWEELQETYGKGYFPDDIKNPADQIVYLSELYDRLQDVYENPYNQNMAEATEFLANDIIDRVISGEMRQAPTTYADRAETRLARETLRGELRVQKVKERLEAERERRKEKIAELKEHYKGKEVKGRENRKAKELRTKIINHAKQMTTELLKPTDKKHVPESLRKSVAAVLSAIDLGSGYDIVYGTDAKYHRVERDVELGAEQTNRTKAFLELKDALMKEADGLVLDPELLGTVEEPGSLTRLITELADVPIANMNTEQLQVVYDALRGIEGAVKSANRMLSQARWGAVSEAADAIRSENGSKIAPLQLAGPAGRVQDLTRLDMLTPEGYFHRLGKSGQAVFKLLRSAQDKFITNMTQATEATRKIVGDADVGALEKETHTLTMSGQEVTMTTAQIMELYCLMQRDQGLQHITTGGVLIEPVRKGIKQETQVEPLHPSMEELLNAVRLLTPDEVKMADALQKYLSEDLAELGNEATLNVYGYKKFGQEAKYWKIRSNKNEIQQSIEKETQTTSVANRGFTKAINPQANTSIKIGSIFDTYSQSVNDMATYAAWLDVGEDVNRIRNYVFRDSDGQRTSTVKGILDRVIGTGGANYLQRLLADIANGAGMDDAGLTSGFVGAYKAAAIGANIRVIVQQPTAILRAAEMIDPKYLAVGLKNPMKAFERAKEYSPIAQWKDWGYFDINTGRKMKDVLFESSSKLEKVRQASMAMAGKADSFAWGQLWGAVEAETKDKTDLKPGTKEFYQACAERFNDIIDHTQVVDGILQRSQIMRSKNAITRMAVSFMSEPTKQYNQFMSAVYDYRHSGDKKKAKQMLARTTFSMLAAGILNVMAQALVDGLRDDDREKKYWEKVLQAFLGYNPDDNTFGEKFKTFAFSNMGEFINPASYLPYAKDIMSIIQGYSVDRMDMDAISDTITAMTRLYKAMNGEGKQSAGYSLVKAMEQGAKLLGLSVYNIDRDLTALFTTIANDADMPVLQYYLNRYRYKPTENLSKDLKGILWDVRQKNDGSYDVIVNRLLKDGYTQEGIDKAMMNRLSDESGFTEARKAADAEGNNNGSYDLGETLAALDSIEVSEEDRDILLEAKLSEKQYSNYTTLLQYSDYDTWLSVMREMPANLSQAKIEAVLDKRDDLTTKQKAAYWQVLSGSTSAKNNPYSQEVGAEILNSKAENQPDKEPEKVAEMRSTLSGLGLQDNKVDALAPVLGGDGSNTSKWRAVANQNLGTDQQDAVLKSIMTDSMYRNWTIASGENISLDSYVKGREAYVDLDDSGTDQNSEWTAALEKVTFDKDATRNNYIKGVLWQIYTGSTSTKNNPFDKTGGQKVLDAKGKGGGKGTGSNAIARIPTLRIPAAPTVSKPSSGLRIRAMTPAAQAPRSGLRIKAQ